MIVPIAIVLGAFLIFAPRGAGPVPPPVTQPVADPQQAKTLAGGYEPTLVLERQDGFWPVSVEAIDGLPPAEERPCLALRKGAECKRIAIEHLPWDRGPRSAFVDYPAGNADPDAERRSFGVALGGEAPATGAQLYYYVTGRSRQRPVTLQYWFYYPFNYLAVRRHGVDLADIDLHEGDFEGLAMLLSARTQRPVYVWMPRHAEEGERFTWEEGDLHRHGRHPVGFVARGSHATYESCGRKFRTVEADTNLGLFHVKVIDVPDDHVSCAPPDRYRLHAGLPLVNLARTWWGCWPGHFGNAPDLGEVPIFGQLLEQIDANGPQSPLFQQKFDEDHPSPCAKVSAPAPPVGAREVLPDPKTARALGVAGGRLDSLFEDCEEWFQRPPEGSYLVACDPVRLRSFFASGLERAGHQRLKIWGDPPPRGPGIPAVFQAPRPGAVDEATIGTRESAHPRVYAAVRDGNMLHTAEFPRFEMRAGERLRLRRPSERHWLLVDADSGARVVRAPVETGEAAKPPKAPTRLTAVRRGGVVEVSFTAGTDRAIHLFVVAGSHRYELHPLGATRGNPSGQFELELRDPEARLRFVRAVASHDGVPATSPVIAIASQAP